MHLPMHEYNEDGNEVGQQAYVDGALVSAWKYEYRDGKLYRTVVYDGSGKITGIETYEYNQFGECILADYSTRLTFITMCPQTSRSLATDQPRRLLRMCPR